MSRASFILNELFQKHYRFRKAQDASYGSIYKFKAEDGTNYEVEVNHFSRGRSSVLFTGALPGSGYGTYGVLGGRANPQKVFSTVHHIIRQHLQKHPEITSMHFSAYGQSRIKLYKHFLDRIAPHRQRKEDDEAHGNFDVRREDVEEPIE